ncbi:hypothetical protein BU24DRAFT_122378 [Aaosphaeria arxii CBS 175.79]|uniref:Uncharacterized protein n=1 Tax=Aaosphaeria arxii CBS 175.79 TaxID=1450172 RepID=A0A6A5Y4X4_9PLEO|nr:uncharacterized protein BU24DRAFT_122378 [Aaosphaeria arxii CBS 175.79]KAF2019574.1 hypothetical protein BU24DRAFT_122378 [Aaosphaeria arxii CBS 175.79]
MGGHTFYCSLDLRHILPCFFFLFIVYYHHTPNKWVVASSPERSRVVSLLVIFPFHTKHRANYDSRRHVVSYLVFNLLQEPRASMQGGQGQIYAFAYLDQIQEEGEKDPQQDNSHPHTES